jgi:putative NIF3 family GTP cyclohydrolase 1 type 2
MADITALELIQRILEKTAAPDQRQSVDRVSAGDPTLAVTGVAVMAMASMECLNAAAAAGCNLIVTYDPAFWSTNDNLTRVRTQALFAQKRDFLRRHDMVVLGLKDRMQQGVATGMAQALGWKPDADNPNLFRRPPATLLALAHELGTKLNDTTLRVVGDPALPVSLVATSFGDTARAPGLALLNGPCDVLVLGYAHEWEVVEYAQDMISAGRKKGLVLLGEHASVESGVKYCAARFAEFIKDVPVMHISGSEPTWT